VGDPEHRVLVRGEGDVDDRRSRDAVRDQGLTPAAAGRPRFDVAVVPSLLLLLARDLLVLDPPRVLAWRLLHDPRLADLPGWLLALLPRPIPDVDRDPIALLLATTAVLLAALYLGGALAGGGTRFRAGVIVAAACALVVVPTLAFIEMGHVLGRPYGQDGGVVQLPLALDKILAGKSPYAADYSDTILAKEARASRFWAERGGNPILRHHAYLPGTHLLAMPFHLAARAMGRTFDTRLLTLLAYALAAWLATRLVAGDAARLSAAALVLVNPLVYWHQMFGANDIVFAAMVLGAALLVKRGRPLAAAVLLGVACGTKQLAWPFAPFLLCVAAGMGWPLGGAETRAALKRLVRLVAIAVVVFAAVVLPVAALDFRAFYSDIVGYNVGLPGRDNYPLGGTPGFGFANFIIYRGAVRSLGDYVPFGVFYLLLVPFGLLLLRETLRRRDPAHAVACGAAAFLASLYFSRVVHPNYVAPLAVLLPVAVLGAALSADTALVPLLLAALAVEIAELGPLKLLWDDAVAARVPAHLSSGWSWLLPRAGPALTDDPLSLVWSATAAGLAVLYLAAAMTGLPRRARAILVAFAFVLVAAVPGHVVAALGAHTGLTRAQNEWVPEVRRGVDRLFSGSASSPAAREAWSTSFREEPARLLELTGEPRVSGPVLLSAPLRALGPDPRVLLVLAAALLGLIAARPRAGEAPWLWPLLLVAAPTAMAIVFGDPSVLGLAVFAGASAWLLRFRARRPVVVLVIAGALALMAACARGDLAVGPGYGLVNLWTYAGLRPGPLALALLATTCVAALIGALRLYARGRVSMPLASAAVSVVGLLAVPAASPDAVVVPLGLLVLAAIDGDA
jgi:hypothetical protein